MEYFLLEIKMIQMQVLKYKEKVLNICGHGLVF